MSILKSLVKFDDLAFILLFFFLIVAVVSFSESAEEKSLENSTSSDSQNSECYSVFMTENKELLLDENIVPFDCFPFGSEIELCCDSGLLWADIIAAVDTLYGNGYSVFLSI